MPESKHSRSRMFYIPKFESKVVYTQSTLHISQSAGKDVGATFSTQTARSKPPVP